MNDRGRPLRARYVPLIALLLTALPATGGAQQAPAPCQSEAHHQFDFWLGSWDVYRPDGQHAGHNQITREMGGCVLHERYGTPAGYGGESFNVYDGSRDVWHQTWVDNQGLLLTLEGGLERGAMVLRGSSGGTVHRIKWSVQDDGPNVRQHWESSTDGGRTWNTAFDGTYVPRGSGFPR